ncbi:hypothetical protein KQX54_001646 [Cotesia glomerata]|uniref:Adenylyl cyclase-associated protein n=1 Tax=Cotesia glomerata TaxID=32391 RepID=A0AAV7I8V7_COTGL|nr:hypothetical protein KQX54_001646 [Cotesia glomerata]
MFSCCSCKKKSRSSNGESSEESGDGSEEVDSIKIELPIDKKNSNLNEESSNIVNENLEQLNSNGNGNHVNHELELEPKLELELELQPEEEEEEEEVLDVIYEVIKPKVKPKVDDKLETDKESSPTNKVTTADAEPTDNSSPELETGDIDVNSEEFINEVKEISREIIRDVEKRSLIIVNEAHRVLINTKDVDPSLVENAKVEEVNGNEDRDKDREETGVDNEINLLEKNIVVVDDNLENKVIKDNLEKTILEDNVEVSSEIEENQSDVSNHDDNSITTVKEIEVNLTDIINEDNILEVKSISDENKAKINIKEPNGTTNAEESSVSTDEVKFQVDKVNIHTPEIIDHVRKISTELINQVEVEVIDEVKKISSEIIDQVEDNITDMITVVEENLLVVNREIEESLSKIRKHSKDRSDVELSLGCEEENLNFTLVKCEEDKEDKSVVDNNNKEKIDVDLDESKEETGGGYSIINQEIIGISSIEGEENLNFTLIKCEEDNSKLASNKSEQDNLIVESNEIETDDKAKNDKQEEAKGVEGGGEDGNEEDNEESDSTSTTVSIKTIDDIKTCKLTLDNIVMGPPTVCLYQAPGYIERTIADGPDDEGDDSVFENSITTEPVSPALTKPPSVAVVPVDKPITRWLSEDDDTDNPEVCGGMQEPPATPVAKDELALRRHRFFSDLMHATNNDNEHKVRFDPLGPMIHPGYENERDEHLEQLVTRLENVTKRLESVPSKFFTETQEVAIQTNFSLPKQVENVDVSTGHEFEEDDQEFPDPPDFGEVEVEVDQNSEVDYSVSMSVGGYEDLVAGPFAEYLALSQKIGGDVAAHSKLVSEAFRIQKEFIKTAASRPAPSNQSEQVSLLGPTSSQIQLIQQFRENNRGSQYFNHLSAISESIPALGWVAVTPTPAPYVKEMNDAGQFYTNRVLKDWKEKDKNHVEWCKAWVQTLSELQKYIRQHHTTGLVWSKTGSVSSSAAAAPPPPPGGMPPPPPCMPVGDISASAGGDDRSALFAQINRGEDITKSLKKVTSDMQTHKNSSLRTGPAPFKAPVHNNSSSPMKSVPPANAPIDKPAVFSRDGKKWLVEYHKGNKDLVIENPEMNNVVYMYRCQDSTLIIKGKLNSIVMDSCRKSSIVFDSLVSSIEFVNCQSVQMQYK